MSTETLDITVRAAIAAQKEARLARAIANAAAQRASELEDAAALAMSISRAVAACCKAAKEEAEGRA